MGKALVIKNVNFSANKLATVVFSEAIPCTGIVLNESTLTMDAIGSTETLIPTLTPANTTDYVLWESSNTDVVTVNNGVITQTGIGSAVITAVCGSQTASCTITAVNTIQFVYDIGRLNHNPNNDTTMDYVLNEVTDSNSYAALESTEETEKSIWYYQGTGSRYPIMLGEGATEVSITAPSTIRVTAWFVDSKAACIYSGTHPTFAYLAKTISGDASPYDKNVALGNRTITVPSGADSVVFSLQYPNNTLTDEIVAEISIVVS